MLFVKTMWFALIPLAMCFRLCFLYRTYSVVPLCKLALWLPCQHINSKYLNQIIITVITIIVSNNYLLTPYSRVLLEKLTGFQLVKKFLAFYGTRMFITAFACARHLSLSWASSILLRSYNIISPGPRISVWKFRNNIGFLRWGVVSISPQIPSWRNTPCRPSATAYPIYYYYYYFNCNWVGTRWQ